VDGPPGLLLEIILKGSGIPPWGHPVMEIALPYQKGHEADEAQNEDRFKRGTPGFSFGRFMGCNPLWSTIFPLAGDFKPERADSTEVSYRERPQKCHLFLNWRRRDSGYNGGRKR